MDRPTRRLVALIRMIGSELEHRRGWQAEVGRRLGLAPSYVSRLLSGERQVVGADAVARAVEHLAISPAFFEQDAEPQDYLQFKLARHRFGVGQSSTGDPELARALLATVHEWTDWVALHQDALRVDDRVPAGRLDLEEIGQIALRTLQAQIFLTAQSVQKQADKDKDTAELRFAFRMLVRAIEWQAMAVKALRAAAGIPIEPQAGAALPAIDGQPRRRR